MSLKNIQKQVDDWIQLHKMGYWLPLEQMARLTEEVGELAREVNHHFGSKKKKGTEAEGDTGDEIADVIFTLVCLANAQNIDLDQAFKKVMAKLNSRDKDRWERK